MILKKSKFLIVTCVLLYQLFSCTIGTNDTPIVGVQDSLNLYTEKPIDSDINRNIALPNIRGINHLGDSIDFQKTQADYILLEFWASWCPPCRKANPELVKVYNEFKGKGFEIFSISLDDKKSKWLDAIYKDKLMWRNHMSDFQGWDSPLALKYRIESIPNNILFDKNGKELAKELSPEQLREMLKTLSN